MNIRMTILVLISIGTFGTFLLGAQALDQSYSLIEEGNASWYGTEFAGKRTANGEIFNPILYTAAHNHLAFNTLAKVTNLATGMSVLVRINDRGPYKPGRILDLSQAAAEAIGLTTMGVARVRIETTGVVQVTDSAPSPAPVETPVATIPSTIAHLPIPNPLPVQSPSPATTPETAKTTVVPTPVVPMTTAASTAGTAPLLAAVTGMGDLVAETGVRTIQLVSYSTLQSAEAMATSLQNRGFNAMVEHGSTGKFRVIVPGVALVNIELTIQQLKSIGFIDVLVRLK